jgi:hypothetical protein
MAFGLFTCSEPEVSSLIKARFAGFTMFFLALRRKSFKALFYMPF